jgi:hypothetical protein
MKTYRSVLIALLCCIAGAFGVLLAWPLFRGSAGQLADKQALFNRFVLSDFCFSTESRHTRNISQPEWIAPFQDLPGYYDHFPSSSFFPVKPRGSEAGKPQ